MIKTAKLLTFMLFTYYQESPKLTLQDQHGVIPPGNKLEVFTGDRVNLRCVPTESSNYELKQKWIFGNETVSGQNFTRIINYDTDLLCSAKNNAGSKTLTVHIIVKGIWKILLIALRYKNCFTRKTDSLDCFVDKTLSKSKQLCTGLSIFFLCLLD